MQSSSSPAAAAGDQRVRVVQVITTLSYGGAEIQMARVLAQLDPAVYDVTVVGLLGDDPLRAELESHGARVVALGMRRAVPDPRALLRLARLLRELRPHVVQTWLYHADLLGTLAALLAGVRTVVWTMQTGYMPPGGLNLGGRLAQRLLRLLARRVPARIICSSHHTQEHHQALGYPAARMVFVPNGADTTTYHPDPAARAAIRAELGLDDATVLIGQVARFHAQKDYHNYVQAAGLLHQRRPDVRFMACGQDVDWQNAELVGWIEEAGVKEAMLLLGLRTDIPAIDAALDLGCLSSAFGETFPLSISETMACAVPCVVTDVGDLGYMVGETGRTVPSRDAAALADALQELVDLSPEARRELGQAALARVEEVFDVRRTAQQYAAVWREAWQAANPGSRGAAPPPAWATGETTG